jgi:hypothetical protein
VTDAGAVASSDRLRPWATGIALATAAVVVVAYVTHAWALIAYPWDWSPDEGLFLDYARRLLDAPETLYPARAVPLPLAYGPLLPLLMAPLVRLPQPLAAARVMALAWSLLGAAAVAVILRRRAGMAWAAVGAALYLAPFDLSYWYMLVRTDAALVALWLWAAVPLLPRELERGSDRLSAGRLALGTAALLAAALSKPTAVLHGLPLVLGWFLVDRVSGVRLLAALVSCGLVVAGALELATGGGFLFANRLWALHPREPGLVSAILIAFVLRAWPVLVMAAVAAATALASRGRPQRDPMLLLLVGGLIIIPLTGKSGAWWNYLLPLLAAAVLVACSSFARAKPPGVLGPVAAIGMSILGLALAGSRTFPLPSGNDEATARCFYGYALKAHRETGGPFLVTLPDLVYFLTNQPTEIEGSSFPAIALAGAPGTEDVLRRLQQGRYTLVVGTWPLPPLTEWHRALAERYRLVGHCQLAWFFGRRDSYFFLRSDLVVEFQPPDGVRCVATPPR